MSDAVNLFDRHGNRGSFSVLDDVRAERNFEVLSTPSSLSLIQMWRRVLCTTNSVPGGEPSPNVLQPTRELYEEFQSAYQTLNAMLFDNELPPCLITLQPRSPHIYGYYSGRRFSSNRKAEQTTDEIALNPIHFKRWNLTTVLQTLAHEMVHEWQEHFGKPSRRGYHNREWSAKMMCIGLHPSSTGKPGGAMVGQQMSDYLIPGGALATTIEVLIDAGFGISWYDRLADVLAGFAALGSGENAALGGHHIGGASEFAPPFARPARSGSRLRFSCSSCRQNAWAKAKASLLCGDCRIAMLPQAGKPRTRPRRG